MTRHPGFPHPATADVAIIGGGLAGASLGLRTAAAGRRVVLIEREAGAHDKVCGEFLSREAVLHLDALGLDPRRLGGHPIGAVRIAAGRATAQAALPFAALGLSRRRLDAALLDAAAQAGATLRRGQRATGLDRTSDGHRIRLADGTVVAAGQAVLATGKHGFRGFPRTGWQNDLVGFKQHLRLDPAQARALCGHIELMLFEDGYAGLQMVEDGIANLCLLLRRSRLAALGRHWRNVVTHAAAGAALLARRLDGAQPLHPRPLAIGGLPYGHVARPDGAGTWRLGDQIAVIPSFTGDGMSLALHSAALAARLIATGAAPGALVQTMRHDAGAQVARATAMSQAGLRRPVQHLVLAATRLAPGLLRHAARATRLPEAALQSTLRDVVRTRVAGG